MSDDMPVTNAVPLTRHQKAMKVISALVSLLWISCIAVIVAGTLWQILAPPPRQPYLVCVQVDIAGHVASQTGGAGCPQ